MRTQTKRRKKMAAASPARQKARPASAAPALTLTKTRAAAERERVLKRGVLIHALYGPYPNKRNLSRLESEASVTYDIL